MDHFGCNCKKSTEESDALNYCTDSQVRKSMQTIVLTTATILDEGMRSSAN